MQPLTRENIRLAATVLLVRDGANGPEVFMLKRPGRGDFPDLHVFPGGKLDAQDYLPEHLQGCEGSAADQLLGVNGGGLRYWVAAIRECFEECGVLLARRGGELLNLEDPKIETRFDGYRHQLLDGQLSLAQLCKRESLSLAGDLLYYFSHWLTPEAAPRRFDTRFFVTRMPASQVTAAHHLETAGAHWVTPKQALAAHNSGDWRMIAPTITTLNSIARLGLVDDIEQHVRNETHLPELTDALRREGMMPLR